jgi:hypothetical protein
VDGFVVLKQVIGLDVHIGDDFAEIFVPRGQQRTMELFSGVYVGIQVVYQRGNGLVKIHEEVALFLGLPDLYE